MPNQNEIGQRIEFEPCVPDSLCLYTSARDFSATIVAGSTNQIRLTGIPAALQPAITLKQIRRIWQFVNGTTPPLVFNILEERKSAATGTGISWDQLTATQGIITCHNAQFSATDTFLVEVEGPQKAIVAGIVGAVTVVQPDPALLNVTEVNSGGILLDTADIETAVELIDNAIVQEDVAPPTTHRIAIAGVDPTTGLSQTPYVDVNQYLHVVIEGGTTPVISTWNCTGVEAVGDIVYNLAGVARRANAAAVATMPCIGVIISKPTAITCVVCYVGDVIGVFGGLAAGSYYYAGIALGAMTLVVPTLIGGFAALQIVGHAKAANIFVVDRQPMVVL